MIMCTLFVIRISRSRIAESKGITFKFLIDNIKLFCKKALRISVPT